MQGAQLHAKQPQALFILFKKIIRNLKIRNFILRKKNCV